MRIFVTGSNGYIGNAFIKEAAKKGIKVYALTRKKKNKSIKNVKWLVGSIEKNWNEFKKIDLLIHLAAEGGYKKFPGFRKCYKFNFTNSKKLIHNSFNRGCTKFLIIGTKKEQLFRNFKVTKKKIERYKKKPDYIYAFTKAIFSNYCKIFSLKKNIKIRIIRLYHVYGGNEKKTRLWPSLIRAGFQNSNFEMSQGLQKTDFNYIDDVVNGLIKSLNFNIKSKNFPQTWDMGSGKSMSIKNFAKLIWTATKSEGKLIFSKKKIFDRNNYKIKKKNLWKIYYRNPKLTIPKNIKAI